MRLSRLSRIEYFFDVRDCWKVLQQNMSSSVLIAHKQYSWARRLIPMLRRLPLHSATDFGIRGPIKSRNSLFPQYFALTATCRYVNSCHENTYYEMRFICASRPFTSFTYRRNWRIYFFAFIIWFLAKTSFPRRFFATRKGHELSIRAAALLW